MNCPCPIEGGTVNFLWIHMICSLCVTSRSPSAPSCLTISRFSDLHHPRRVMAVSFLLSQQLFPVPDHPGDPTRQEERDRRRLSLPLDVASSVSRMRVLDLQRHLSYPPRGGENGSWRR